MSPFVVCYLRDIAVLRSQLRDVLESFGTLPLLDTATTNDVRGVWKIWKGQAVSAKISASTKT